MGLEYYPPYSISDFQAVISNIDFESGIHIINPINKFQTMLLTFSCVICGKSDLNIANWCSVTAISNSWAVVNSFEM